MTSSGEAKHVRLTTRQGRRQCQSYRDGYTCADGFIQKPICRGVFGCPHCGSLSASDTPNCMKDELPDHYVNDDGGPRFYRITPSGLTALSNKEGN